MGDERHHREIRRGKVCNGGGVLILVLLAGFVLLACSSLVTSSSDGGTGKAVLVGVSLYRVPSFNLRFADDDALDYFNALIQGSNWDPSRITVLLNGAATKSTIISSINSVGGSLSSDDKFIFFFSGHGTVGPDQPPLDEPSGLDSYIVPHDALSNSHANDISDDELTAILGGLPTKNILVVLDSSFSGGFIKSRLRLNGRVKFIDRGLIPADRLKSSNGMTKDLDRLTGVITQTASDANESPLESNALRNGVFTFYMTEGMLGPADPNGPSISAQEAFAYAAPRSTAFFSGMHPQQQDNRGSTYTLIVK